MSFRVSAQEPPQRRDLRTDADRPRVADAHVDSGISLNERAVLELVLTTGREHSADTREEAERLGCGDTGGDTCAIR